MMPFDETHYITQVKAELAAWERQLLKPNKGFEHLSKQLSRKVNSYIPQKVHDTITSAIKGMIHTIRTGVRFTPKGDLERGKNLQQMDRLADQRITKWTQWATAEGAGTGAAGFKLSLVDFPALLSIKMKMLSDLAYIYGYDPNERHEKLFVLYIFQLTYAEPENRMAILDTIKTWPSDIPETIDWERFQQDYRDSLDFKKMLQMVPGFGAIVGAWANHGFVRELGQIAIRAHQIRKVSNH